MVPYLPMRFNVLQIFIRLTCNKFYLFTLTIQDGNLVISGGTKVFHLHPGVAPPPSGSQGGQEQQHHQHQQDHRLFPAGIKAPPSTTAAAATDNPQQQPAASEPFGRLFPLETAADGQRVVEVLKSARTAHLELEMDNRERMVLRINNDELLPILEALQKALSRVQVDHV